MLAAGPLRTVTTASAPGRTRHCAGAGSSPGGSATGSGAPNGFLTYNPIWGNDNYVNEEVKAAYLQYQLKGELGSMPFNVNAGYRIEDTDVERSTPEAVQAILDGMEWLNLQHDEGPFYQMRHMDRYKAVIDQLLADGKAYYCYTTPEELDALREAQRARNEKPRYDGRWRPEPTATTRAR